MTPLIAILALALTVSAQVLNSDYSKVCPSKDGQTDTLPGGYKFTYHCGKTGKITANYGAVRKVATAEECAATCQGNPRCMGSAWNPTPRLCDLYDSSEVGPRVLGVVFMSVSDRGSSGGDCEQPPEQGLCPERHVLPYYQEAAKRCDLDSPNQVEIDRVKYEIICNRFADDGFDPVATHSGSFDDCVRECKSLGNGCAGLVYYVVQDADQCVLFPYISDTTVVSTRQVITVVRLSDVS